MAKLSNDARNELGKENFAFPKERKEPLENASHVRIAISRFNQVKDVSDDERDVAWKRIKTAAKKLASRSRRRAGEKSENDDWLGPRLKPKISLSFYCPRLEPAPEGISQPSANRRGVFRHFWAH